MLATSDIPGFSPSGYSGNFPSPWRTAAAAAMPTQYTDALRMCQYCWNSDATYRTAQERLIAYFLTDIEFSAPDDDNSVGDDDKSRWEQLLNETIDIRTQVIQCGIDRACYGNAFASLCVPFKRFLISPTDGSMYEFKRAAESSEIRLKYSLSENKFTGICPKSGKHVTFRVDDLPDDFTRKLSVKWWSPHEIDVVFDPWSNKCEYIWKIPDTYRRELQSGNMHVIGNAPLKVLEAASAGKWFKFAPGAIHHSKEMSVSGLNMQGVGLSRVLLNFRDIWHVQLLRCYNEAIAMDYVIPLRLITPESSSSGTAPTSGLSNMGDAANQLRSMLRRRRTDMTAWQILPFPVKYDVIGGDAKNLVPHELLDWAQDVMLNGSNVPAQLYRGNLELQTAPVSLRWFEATNVVIVRSNNTFLHWLIEAIGDVLPMPTIKADFARVTHADDFQRAMAELQLFMGRQVSGTTAFGSLGLDYKNEQRTLVEEQAFQGKLQAEMQDEMNQSAYGEQIAKGQAGPGAAPGGAPAGGAPGAAPGGAPGAAPGGAPAGGADPALAGGPGSALASAPAAGSPVPLDDMMAQADAVAGELLSMPSSSQRISELRKLKDKNEALHHMVKAKMDEQRNAAASAGKSMLLAG